MLSQITNLTNSKKYKEAIHNLIPGGAHTYSKGDDQFPTNAPAAISHGKGAYLWDVDKNKFLDCSMGLTSVSLGHAYEPVLDAVRAELERGVNFQRPSVLEMTMAEKFLELVPGHQMIKFAKNGSTATTAAVKLARAFTGRKLVAYPGDHPFYSYDDWFIGTTVCDKGVPEQLKTLTVTYNSLDLKSLEDLFAKYPNQIACIISEPEKTALQADNYIQTLIDICHKNGALYIMDEMVTGFKTGFPGSMQKMKVVPDMATWGKGIANGFSFCALTGKKEIMELGGITNEGTEKVFLISTTHGGETHAMAACLATVEEFKMKNVLKHSHELGEYTIKKFIELAEKKSLSSFAQVTPTNWLQAFIFKNKKGEPCPGMRTLMLQEMIKRGILFQGILYPTFSHTKNDVDFFMEAMGESLDVMANALEAGYEKFLIGQPIKPVFRKKL